MKLIATATIAAATLLAGPALAQQVTPFNQGWYFGGGVGLGYLGTSGDALKCCTDASVRDHQTVYTLRGGWRFMPWLAAEVGYYDLGRYDFHGIPAGGTTQVDGSARVQSASVSLVGILPIDQFDLYGRVGFGQSRVRVNAGGFSSSDNRSETTYGAGGRWNFMPNWSVFAEWFKDDKVKVDSYVLGVDFHY